MRGVIPEGTSTLHFILWKFIIIELTMVSLKGKPFSSEDIIEPGLRRLARKLNGVQYAMTCAKNKTDSRHSKAEGETPPTDYSKFEKWVAGIATVVDGKLQLADDLLVLFHAYEINWYSPPHNSGPS